ncbi:MAG: hypothetical protein Kow0099_10220 [Candidatus Abyssubacteria bacterium]
MEKPKLLVVKYFEELTVAIVLLSVVCITYAIHEKMVMLNFYYLPVLMAGYFIGKRASVLVAIFSILAVVFFAVLKTEAYAAGRGFGYLISSLSGWAGFLLLTGGVVGTLNEQKQRRIEELQQAYVGILEILVKYLETTDRYTRGHSQRVADLASEIAAEMGLSHQDIENIRVAALLHDIGKVEISANLIGKAARLSRDEMMQVAQHTEKGAKILLSVGTVLKEAIPIVLEHHKYFAGTNGDGKKNGTSLGTSIVAVADSFDAMTSDRPYRKGMQPWQAMEEIRRCSGEQFDPKVVEVFESVLSHKLETV